MTIASSRSRIPAHTRVALPLDRLPSSPYRSTPCCAPQRPRGCGIVGSSAGSESGRSHGERRRDRKRAARIWIVDTEDLVIQYEVAVEVGALTGNFAAAGDMGEGLRRGAGRRAGQDAGRVKRGLHLCYGDYKHRHFTVPEDLSLCVELADAVGEAADFIRMPADRETGRDPVFFEPLRELSVRRLALSVTTTRVTTSARASSCRRRRPAAAGSSSPSRPSAAWPASTSAAPERRHSNVSCSCTRGQPPRIR